MRREDREYGKKLQTAPRWRIVGASARQETPLTALIVFLGLYSMVMAWFFVALVKWTVRSERGCACRGSLGSGRFDILHGPKMCYPMLEALPAR